MSKTLNKEQADTIVLTASVACAETPGYRWGQALFNELPKDVADSIRDTELDMFYTRSDMISSYLFNKLSDGSW